MKFDEAIFIKAMSDKNKLCFEGYEWCENVVKRYLELASQKEAKVIDKQVCVSEFNKKRLETIATACLQGIYGNNNLLMNCNNLEDRADFAIKQAKVLIERIDNEN